MEYCTETRSLGSLYVRLSTNAICDETGCYVASFEIHPSCAVAYMSGDDGYLERMQFPYYESRDELFEMILTWVSIKLGVMA